MEVHEENQGNFNAKYQRTFRLIVGDSQGVAGTARDSYSAVQCVVGPNRTHLWVRLAQGLPVCDLWSKPSGKQASILQCISASDNLMGVDFVTLRV